MARLLAVLESAAIPRVRIMRLLREPAICSHWIPRADRLQTTFITPQPTVRIISRIPSVSIPGRTACLLGMSQPQRAIDLELLIRERETLAYRVSALRV